VAKHPAKCPKCKTRLEYESAVDGQVVCPGCKAVLTAPGKGRRADPLLGQALGEFEILELIGRGGMGAVYKGRQPSLDRFVAIKVLPQRFAEDASFLERFHREARAAAAISHPNIIEVYAVGQDKGHEFIAMEFVDGDSLAGLLKREGRLPPERALEIMRDVASALADAHAKGIVHRDIKPANILLTARGRVKVADFGLAKRAGVDISVTHTGASLGTPLYMAPEIARGELDNPSSDLYALGATFYQAISGRPPFDGATPAELIVKHVNNPVPPLQSLAPECPPALCRIIHLLLSKNPAHRHSSADKLVEALDKVGARLAGGAGGGASVPRVSGPVGGASAPRVSGPVGGASLPRVSDATRTLPGSVAPPPAPMPHSRRVGGVSSRRVFLFGGIAAAVLLAVVVFIALPGPASQSTIRNPKSPVPPSATPGTQHPTPSSSAFESHAALCLQYARTCVERKDWAKAKEYLDELADKYAATRVAADNKSAIAALRSQAEAVLKPTPMAKVGPKVAPEVEPKGKLAQEWTALANGWRVGKPVNLGPVVNSANIDNDPCISADGRTLLFSSNRQGWGGVWMCRRGGITEDWAPPVKLGPPMSTGTDVSPHLSADGLTLLFASERPGGQGERDLWSSTRRTPDEPWGPPVNLGSRVNSSGSDITPALSADGLTLLFSSDRPGGQGGFDLWICTRNTPAAPWSSPANLGSIVNRSQGDAAPDLSSDGLTLFFQSGRPGGQGGMDLWMCTRRSLTEPFGEAVNLGAGVNCASTDSTPSISADGRTLYFASDRPGGSGGADVYRVSLLRPEPPADEWTTLANGWRVGKPVNLGPVVNSAGTLHCGPTVSTDGLTLLFAAHKGSFDLWMSSRRSTREEWGAPATLGPPVNGPGEARDPCLSSDGLTLLFASGRPGGQGQSDLWMSVRRRPDDPWEPPTNLGPTVNSVHHDSQPCLSSDGLTLLYCSSRPSGAGGKDLWMCTRAAAAAPWGAPVHLGPRVNTPAEDQDPCLSPDGLALFFSSNRRGKDELWMCTRQAKSEPFGEPVNLGAGVNSGGHARGPALSADGRTLYFDSDLKPGKPDGSGLWQAPLVPPEAAQPAPPPADDARWGPWEELFDGKTLKGWERQRGQKFDQGKAQVDGDRILLFGGRPAASIGWTGAFPDSDYEVEVEAMRTGRQNCFCAIGFPIGQGGATFVAGDIDGTAVGLDGVDGKDALENATGRRKTFAPNRWYRVRVQVAQGRVRAWIDGEQVVDLPTAGHMFTHRDPNFAFRVMAWAADAAVRTVRLRQIKAVGAQAPTAGPADSGLASCARCLIMRIGRARTPENHPARKEQPLPCSC